MKKLVYVLLGIAALIIIAAISFVLLFDPNAYRERLSTEVTRITGREFVIEGEIELSIFPWLAIDVGRTRLGNAEGFGDEPFASFERARLSVQLLPMLLRREVSVGTATLDALQLNLAVDKNGRSNWQDLLEADEAPAEAEEASTTASPGDFEVAGIAITNAAIRYTDASLGESYTLSEVELSTGAIAAGTPISIAGGFNFELQPADIAGDLTVDAIVALDGDAGTIALPEVEATILGIEVSASVNPMPLDGAIEPVARFETAPFSLQSLMQRMNIEPIATADSEALEKIRIAATARVTPAALALEDLELQVDDTTFKGNLSVASDAVGTISVELAGDSINLDRYMAPAAEADVVEDEVIPIEIPVDLVRSLNVRGNLTLEEARLSGMAFTDVTLGINAGGGKLRMHPISAAFFDGRYEGDVRIDASGAEPKISVNENIRDVNVGALVQTVFDTENVTGRINGSFRLGGAGADLGDIQRSLAGRIEFELVEGAFEGTDLWYELRRARALLKQEQAPEPSLPARTRFSSVRLNGPVEAGVFRTEEMFAELPFMQVNGSGNVDFAAAEVDLRVSARVLDNPELADAATADEIDDLTRAVIPVRITGPLTAPSVTPDIESLLKKEAERKVKDMLRDKLLGGGDEEAATDADATETTETKKKKKKSDRDKVKDALRGLLGD
jgi:AsmA protein